MADGASVGVISLDLVIKNKVQEQLDKISASIQNGFSKPVEQAEKAVENAMDKTTKAIDEGFGSASEIAQKSMQEATAKVVSEIDKANEHIKNTTDQIENIKPKVVQIHYNPEYDPDKIEAEVDDIAQQITAKADEAAKTATESFGDFEIPESEFERLNLQLENATEKMSLLQAKYKELNGQLADTDDSGIDKLIGKLNSVEAQMIRQQAVIDKTKAKMGDLSNLKALETEKIVAAAVAEVEQQASLAAEKLRTEALSAAMETAEGFKTAADPLERLKQKFEINQNAIERTETEIKRLQAELTMTDDAMESEKLSDKIEQAKSQLIVLYDTSDKLSAKIKEGGKSFSVISSAAKRAANLVKSAFKAMKSVGSKAVDAVKSKFSRLKTTIDSTSKPLSKFTHSLKSAAKRVFLMAGVLVLLKGIRSAVANAVSGNEEFAKSLNEIKANLTIAFTPIMNTVMPYLNTLMTGVSTATKTVAAFVSELFGTTYQKSLQATKQAQKSAEKIKKTQDTYLADFDVVRVAPDQSKSDTDSSEGGIDYSAINGDNVQLPDWAERMKDAIKSGDWAGVGSLVAEKVNGAFAYINWDGIQKKLNGFVDKLTDGLNSFINGVDWTGLGDSFGGGINTIFGAGYRFMKKFDWAGFGKGTADFLNGGIKKTNWSLIGKTLASKWQAIIDYLYSFVTTFDWSGFGSSIGTSVNGWFDEIDWGKAGTTISEGVKGLLDTAINFLQTVNWRGIGEKLWTFISTIDWSGIVTKLFKAIGSAIGGAVSVLWGFIKDAVFSIRDYFTEKIQDCGGNIVEGLFTGIVDAFKGIGTWLYDHVLTPFIEGFKNCFGIHSPSKVMAEMGGYIIQGLYNAVSEGIAKIKEIFTKLLNAVKGVFKGIGKWFKKTFSDAFGGVKTILNGIIMFVKSIFTGNWKKAWQGVKKIFKGVWDTLYSVVKAPINLIIGAVNKMTSAIESAVNWIIDGINSLSFDVPDWVPGIGGETFGFDLDTISIPEIPKLATGGLATAPTLAMVGDNRNAKADPEVISPLSKLQGMLDNGKLDEVLRVLNAILDWLKAYDPVFFGTVDSKVLFKCMQDSNNQYKRKTGVSAF
ncbi:hypothetical protein FFK04_07295 [Ruminococcus sp. KGMB03662]|nr:hypothetical protein FFK04_07295 [Ruminococcus sp. KGMB03662]